MLQEKEDMKQSSEVGLNIQETMNSFRVVNDVDGVLVINLKGSELISYLI